MDSELTTTLTLTHTDVAVLVSLCRKAGDSIMGMIARIDEPDIEAALCNDMALILAVAQKLAAKNRELEAKADLDFTSNAPEAAYATHHIH